jgi:transposase
MSLVVLGVDPHKQSHTGTALTAGSQQPLGSLRIPASPTGNEQLLGWARQFPQRRWAIENARGLGCHLTQWLLAGGETVQDVRTTATARVRELSRGRGRKTDALDAAAAAGIAALQGDTEPVQPDDATVVLAVLEERRSNLVGQRTPQRQPAPCRPARTHRWRCPTQAQRRHGSRVAARGPPADRR